jgi:hypothetical protein
MSKPSRRLNRQKLNEKKVERRKAAKRLRQQQAAAGLEPKAVSEQMLTAQNGKKRPMRLWLFTLAGGTSKPICDPSNGRFGCRL